MANTPDNMVAPVTELRNLYQEIEELTATHAIELGSALKNVQSALVAGKDLVSQKSFLLSVEEKIANKSSEIFATQARINQLYRDLSSTDISKVNFAQAEIAKHILKQNQLTKERLGLQNQLIAKQAAMNALTKIGLGTAVTSIMNIKSAISNLGQGGGIQLFTMTLDHIIDVFDRIDKTAAEFRRTMGLTRIVTKDIDQQARDISFSLAHVGVTSKDVYDSAVGIAESFGSAAYLTKDVARDMSLMSAQLGVSAKTSAEFLKSMSMMGATTAKAQKDMMLFTAKMSEAAGTNLNEVMADISSATKSSYSYMTKYPLALAKAAIFARQLGTTIAETASSSKKLIDFTSSVRAEMEASVLAGEAINLQRARELAYRRDLKGLNQELLRLAKQHKFEEMDPFQQEAFAAAVGKSADELGRMVQSQKERGRMEAEIMAHGTAEQKKQLADLKRMESAKDNMVKSEAELAREQLTTLANQSRIQSISQSWAAITARLAEAIFPVIDTVLGSIAKMLGTINSGMGIWTVALAGIGAGVIILIGSFKLLSTFIGKAIGSGISAVLQGFATGLAALGSSIAVTGPGVLVLLGIAAAITILAAGIYLIMKALPAAAEGFRIFVAAVKTMTFTNIAMMAAMVPVLFALGPALLSFAVGAAAGGGAMGLLARGFSAIGSGLASLVDPNLGGAISQMNQLAVAVRALNSAIDETPLMKIEAIKGMASIAPLLNAFGIGPKTEKSEEMKALEAIKESIDNMHKALSKGGIPAVLVVDGQYLSSFQARQSDFINGYGANNARLAGST